MRVVYVVKDGQLKATVDTFGKNPHATYRGTKRVLALAFTLVVSCSLSQAGELLGPVVGVSDGDTITVLDVHQTAYKIRLAGIDAPEKAQPYGQRAKQQLSEWLFHENVRILHDKTDRYGRLVGKVLKDEEDVNIQMIHVGLAWHYRAYEGEQPYLDRVTYPLAELNARKKAIGLWADLDPVPPRKWRHFRSK